jgi:hypothetical protein
MIKEYMRLNASSKALFGVLFITAALIGTPLAIFALQQQQEIRQRADTTLSWATDQSASTVCAASGVNISVTFTNSESNKSSTAMTVVAKDSQTNKTVNLGSVTGGQTKSDIIETDKTTLAAGSVTFALTWTDGHSGTDSRTASYKAVSNCNPPTPTPTPTTPPTPKPSIYPSPTICPTLGPVKNVRIDCPNCPK